MQQFQQSMDVIGNNIANVNTTGFKGARIEFEDALSQTLGGPGPGGSMQVGTGVGTGSISNEFVQGAITQTGVGTDMAISGNGFFQVHDTVSGAYFVTRAGDFHLDSGGYLVTSDGMRVQGYNDEGLTTRGDIQINDPNAAAGSSDVVDSFSIDKTGVITAKLSDGTEFTRGQILLQNFQNPQALVKEGNNLYSAGTSAGPLSQTEAPGSNGMGYIQSNSLEMSNVDLANEFASIITTQRAFQASARVITTSDEILQELVNLKR